MRPRRWGGPHHRLDRARGFKTLRAITNVVSAMGITSRAYIVSENGIKRVPRDVLQGLVFGQDALPEYAGTTQRAVCVILDNEDGKPLRILEAQGSYWVFNAAGRIDEHLRKGGGAAMSFAFMSDNRDGKVVSLSPSIRRQEFKKEHRWDVDKETLDLIAADIWPAKGLRASDVASVKGIAPKRPPMTSEAKYALAELGPKLSHIAFELSTFTEPTLRAIAFQAREDAECETDHPELWRGLAAECDRQLEIRKRHRTGKGTWYAVVELFRHKERHLAELVKTVHEKCNSKAKAIAAVRKLIVATAPDVGDEISLDSRVVSDLEWSPDAE